MQMVPPPIYPQRVLYYWAVLYGQQLREGERYDRLQPTISISFVNKVLFPEFPEYHLDFQLRCSQRPELVFTEQQSVHLIELPKFTRRVEELGDELDAWCYFLVHGASLDPDNLPAALRIPAIVRAMEVLKMLAQSELERERYEARLKDWRDRVSFEDAVKEAQHAASVALEKGMEKGMEKGTLLGRIRSYEEVLKLPVSSTEELGAVPLEELRARAQSLARQLGLAVSE